MSRAATDLFLCLDQGGHASRALAIDATGHIHAQAFHPIDTQREAEHVEHDPAQIVSSLRASAEQVVRELGDAAQHLVAAGFATQRSSIVCWNRVTGEALTPVLSWQDTRAASWLKRFVTHAEQVHDVTGLMLSPHYGVSKMNWCLEHVSAVREAHARNELVMGPLAAFIVHQMLAEHPVFADPANASRTLLWDRRACDWSGELLELFSIPAECLPQSVPSRHAWGELRLANLSIPVTVVTGDQSAALFAFGSPAVDTVYANLGTGAFLQRCFSQQEIAPGRLLASVVYRDAEQMIAVLEGTVNGAGSAINALCAELGIEPTALRANSARWLKEHTDVPLFINGISGLGSPWWLADVDSRFVGEGTPEEKIAAVMESVAFLLVVNLETMNSTLGRPGRLVVTGGLGSVDPLLQRIANLSHLEVTRARVTEATARGLAFLLAGQPDAWPDIQVESSFVPASDASLEARFERWRAAMPAIPA